MKRILPSNKKIWFASVIAVTLVTSIILTGCSSDDTTGTIKFYDEPTEEFTVPADMNELPLSSKQVKEIKSIIKNVAKWTDDHYVDRVLFYFDGEFKFSDSDVVYYFSYEHSVIYYDHYYGRVTEEGMGYIKQIQCGTAPTDGNADAVRAALKDKIAKLRAVRFDEEHPYFYASKFDGTIIDPIWYPSFADFMDDCRFVVYGRLTSIEQEIDEEYVYEHADEYHDDIVPPFSLVETHSILTFEVEDVILGDFDDETVTANEASYIYEHTLYCSNLYFDRQIGDHFVLFLLRPTGGGPGYVTSDAFSYMYVKNGVCSVPSSSYLDGLDGFIIDDSTTYDELCNLLRAFIQ